METKSEPKTGAETATIELKATVAAICYLPADPGSVEMVFCLLPSSKSPVELKRQEGEQALGAPDRQDELPASV
jgi:hypothetical protein